MTSASGSSASSRSACGEVGGPDEPGPGARPAGGGGSWQPGREAVVLVRVAERERGVADRAVAGAPAQVAAQRVQVEAVVRLPVRAVVLGGHAADEARRAVAALRAAADRHLVLDRVQGLGRAEALGGDDLLAVERGRRQQAGVQRGPLGRGVDAGPGDEHGAGAALTLGAALLGAGQTLVAQPVERGGVRRRRRAGGAGRSR